MAEFKNKYLDKIVIIIECEIYSAPPHVRYCLKLEKKIVKFLHQSSRLILTYVLCKILHGETKNIFSFIVLKYMTVSYYLTDIGLITYKF